MERKNKRRTKKRSRTEREQRIEDIREKSLKKMKGGQRGRDDDDEHGKIGGEEDTKEM